MNKMWLYLYFWKRDKDGGQMLQICFLSFFFLFFLSCKQHFKVEVLLVYTVTTQRRVGSRWSADQDEFQTDRMKGIRHQQSNVRQKTYSTKAYMIWTRWWWSVNLKLIILLNLKHIKEWGSSVWGNMFEMLSAHFKCPVFQQNVAYRLRTKTL